MKKLALAAAFLLAAVSASAQDTPLISRSGDRPLIRPDGTYVFQHIPHSDLVFEGQIAPRIIILDSIGRATLRVLAAEKPSVWGYQVSTTPMVRLRMFDETSNPVRTPSYMPKATVQFARFKNLSTSTDVDETAFRGPVATFLIEVIPFGHHSNGQDGCLFTSQSRDEETDECVEVNPTPERTINTENGSFSTNYIEATVHYGRQYLDSPGEEKGETAGDFVTRAQWRIGLGMQFNPEGYVGGSIKPEVSDLYGPTRVIFEAMGARRDLWRCGRVGGDMRLQFLTDKPDGIPAVITRIEGTCFPRRWGGAGIFVAFYHGQDYYNLGFTEKISRLQFGVTLQREQFLSFRIGS